MPLRIHLSTLWIFSCFCNIFVLKVRANATNEIVDKLKKAKKDAFKHKYEGCNIIVKNLPKEINDKQLFDIFKQFGGISSARISTEGMFKEVKDSNGMVIDKAFVYESKGFGFVLFKKPESAKDVLYF